MQSLVRFESASKYHCCGNNEHQNCPYWDCTERLIYCLAVQSGCHPPYEGLPFRLLSCINLHLDAVDRLLGRGLIHALMMAAITGTADLMRSETRIRMDILISEVCRFRLMIVGFLGETTNSVWVLSDMSEFKDS